MPATPPVSAAMQLQFLNYMKTDATPDIELQKAHEEAEARQREVWERERKRKLEEERLERERMQRDAEEEAARRKEVLKLKREELIQQATGGDSMLAELIERYMAVKMFDTI